MQRPQSLLRTIRSISSATALSRVLGLLRDQVQSYYFGAGLVTDAFVAAFRIPNLLRDLFAEGALSSAFVPTFTAERERNGDASAWRLANRLLTALILILSILTVLIWLGAPWILSLYAAGFEPAKMAIAVTMTRILSPFLLFVALAAVAMGVLNTCGRYFLPALAPAAFNVAAILGVILLVPLLLSVGAEPVLSLALGAMAGGVLQFAVQLPALHREGFRLRMDLALGDPGLRRIGRLMLPATLGLAATQINILVDTWLASRYGNGPITYLQLAFRLMQLPLGLFGVAIGTANLVRVSRGEVQRDHALLRGHLAAALRYAGILTLPATFGLIALREPIVRLLFEHGQFDSEDTARTAAAVLCYSLGLFAYSATKIQVPMFYALGDTRTPLISSAASVTVKIAANFGLIAALGLFRIDPFLGLALSTSLAAWVNFGSLAFSMRKAIGSLSSEHRVVPTMLRSLGASIVMALLCWTLHAALERWLGGGGLPGEATRLLLAIAAGLVFLLLARRWSGWSELRRGLGRDAP